MRGEYGPIDIEACVEWTRQNEKARKDYYERPFLRLIDNIIHRRLLFEEGLR